VCVYIYIYIYIYTHTHIFQLPTGEVHTVLWWINRTSISVVFLTGSYANRRKKFSGTTSRGKRPRPILHRGTQLPQKGQSEPL